MTTNGHLVEVVYDVETKKLFEEITTNDPADLGISIVSVYRREINSMGQEVSGEMKSFWTDEVRGIFGEKELYFEHMWEWFEEADRIIGYNSLGFDNPAMNGIYTKGDFTKLKHFDVLEEIRKVFGHRVKLDSVAKETIGAGKSADGLDAVKWWNKRDQESLVNLKKYCEMDVEVTTKVYDFAKKNGKLMFKDRWHEFREIEVDFSYPVEVPVVAPAEVQMGLF
jgi:DEAD/DEAH box helicase domain-containing protein